MIIVNSTKKKKSFLLPLLIVASISAVAMFAVSRESDPPITFDARVFCDAENKNFDNKFECGDYIAKNGHTQSTEEVYSGSYSSKVNKENKYSFSVDYKDFAPNDRIQVRAWIKSINHKDVYLAAQGKEPYKFYEQSAEVVTTDNKWRKKLLEFQIPSDYTEETISIFAYTSNIYNPAFIDDFEIINLNRQHHDSKILDSLGTSHSLYFDLKALKKLEAVRKEALELGILTRGDDDWVKAKLNSEGEEYEVKARLKGDWTDHLSGDFWSFRIKMPKDASWNRLMTFSLQNPNSRFSLAEWVFHQFLEYEDVLTPRYDFVRLAINDGQPKTYAYEEHFVKQLVEFKKRREGVIIKFSEADYWDVINKQLTHNTEIHSTVPNQDLLAEIEPFKESKIIGDAKFQEQFNEAAGLLSAFQSSEASIAEVFDVDRLGKYYAICDVMKAFHSTIWHNRRFYYNPVIRKLEPIGFDGFASGGPFDWHNKAFLGAYYSGDFPDNNSEQEYLLYRDIDFNLAYTKYLHEFSAFKYLDEFLESINSGMLAREKLIQRNDPDYKYDMSFIHSQAKRIRASLSVSGNEVKAYKNKTIDGDYQIELTNAHALPMQLLGFSSDNKTIIPYEKELLIYSNARWEAPEYTTINVNSPYKFVHFKLAGRNESFSTRIRAWPAAKPLTITPTTLSIPLAESAWSQDGNNIIIGKGAYIVKEPMIIPKEKILTIDQGTTLDFQDKSYLLSYSPIFINGTKTEPITVLSSDNSSQGMHILNAKEKSNLEYVSFNGLNTLSTNAWQMTGAVTFYESPVNLQNVTIGNNKCEDALNTIRSNFTADGLHINNTYADGFDADFCKGVIKNSKFVNTGNDGIDFSGSIIEVNDVSFNNIGDKAISVGEEATVTVKSAYIDKAIIGVASKDLSKLNIKNIEMRNCNTGFAAYQKKPEFGPGRIEVDNYKIENIEVLQNKDSKSVIKFKKKSDEEI